MGLADSLAAFAALVPRLVLPSTPARVCTATGAVHKANVSLARADGSRSEQFYKWQLIHGLIASNTVPADCIAAELPIPRGSRGSTNLLIDVVIFRDSSWVGVYDDLVQRGGAHTWDDLYDLIVSCGEIKDDPDDDPETTIARQVVPALGASQGAYALGFYYNAGHLVLMARSVEPTGVALKRLDPVRQAAAGTGVRALNPAVPDSYGLFPTLDLILRRAGTGPAGSRSGRHIADLDIASSRSQGAVSAALDAITRTLDQVSMTSEVGYRIVVETLAMKVHDEKQAADTGSPLEFFIDATELPRRPLHADGKQFRDRMRALHGAATAAYPSILGQSPIQWNNPAHLQIVAEVVLGFQDVSFLASAVSDLYQVVFYNFAAPLSKAQQAQFVTPLAVIDFMVKIADPEPAEDVCDPTMGIADFLAETFRYRIGLLAGSGTPGAAGVGADERLYGIDNDSNMRMLAGLNMLLNGDGKANLVHEPDTGSLDHKFVLSNASGTVQTTRLDHEEHADGAWDLDPQSGFQLKKFDVVLTNPPFGDQRALKLNDPAQGAANRSLAKLFDVRHHVSGNQIDRGLLFLENTIRILKPGGRFGIILSTSLAGVREYEDARRWLLGQARIVALFDLPENIFAEAGVPTTIIFGYMPEPDRLRELQDLPYEVYTHRIARVGFFKATRRRTSLLLPKYLIDPATGVVQHDPLTGAPLLDQEFDDTVADFRRWAATQEPELTAKFVPRP